MWANPAHGVTSSRSRPSLTLLGGRGTTLTLNRGGDGDAASLSSALGRGGRYEAEGCSRVLHRNAAVPRRLKVVGFRGGLASSLSCVASVAGTPALAGWSAASAVASCLAGPAAQCGSLVVPARCCWVARRHGPAHWTARHQG